VLQAMLDNDASALASFRPITGLLVASIGPLEVAQALILLVAVPLFAVWVHRIQSNSFALGILGLRYTPAWAVGWFLVPVANLWMPYRVMQEMWRANRSPAGWQLDPANRLLILWWLLWLGSVIYIRIYFTDGTPLDALLTEIGNVKVEGVKAAFRSASSIASLVLVTLLQQFQVRVANQSLAHVFE
jgi:Domain of unknown function (DUF4328)